MDKPLWQPSAERIASANLTAFIGFLNDRYGVAVSDYAALHAFSVDDMEAFWAAVWDFCGVIAETRGDAVVRDLDRMPGATWFPDARLNFAENLLRRRDDADAELVTPRQLELQRGVRVHAVREWGEALRMRWKPNFAV